MANHEPGSKSNKINGEAKPIQPSQASLDQDKDNWRKAYASNERFLVLEQPKARANFGGDGLFTPPVEFLGYEGGFNFGTDYYSDPLRYGYGCGFNGFKERDGWTYRGGRTNIDHQRIAQCILLYKTEGIVQTIVHLLADFVVENVDIVHPNTTVHNFYQAWKAKVKLKERLHRFVVDLLMTGNVFIWTKQAKLKTPDQKSMKRGIGAKLIGNDLVVTIEDTEGKKLRHATINVEMDGDIFSQLGQLADASKERAEAGAVSEVVVQADTRNDPANPQEAPKAVQIPWGYISLNPLQMQPRGSRFANEHYWVMMLNQRDLQPLSKFMNYRYYSDISTTKVNLPEVFKGKLRPVSTKDAQSAGYAAELVLDKSRLAVIQDVTKTDYEDWATPQIYPAHKEVMFKRMLRQGEMSAMESLKHMITLIKLGDVKEGFIPTDPQLERVAQSLAGGSQAHHLVWDNLIEGQVLQPNIGNIFDPKKYQQVDRDIYASLGVSQSVMSGDGSYANSFLAIKLLLEKLETIRNKLEDWLNVEVKKIADVMKFRRLPLIQWGMMNLRDENAERALILDLYDRGILSDTTILERFDADFDVEQARQEMEARIKEEKNADLMKDDTKFKAPIMVSKGPFSNQVKPQAKKNGRPTNTGGKPQEKERKTKPQGMGKILEFQKHYGFAKKAMPLIMESVTEALIQEFKLKDSRSLSKAQKLDIEKLTLGALVNLSPTSELSSDLVYKLLSEQSEESFPKIAELYNAELTAEHSKEQRLDLMCNAYAVIHSGV